MSEALLEEVPIKKQKLNDEPSSDDLVSQYKKKIMSSKSKLKVVLADEYTNPVPMTKAYVGFIKNVKNISSTMKILNEKLPLKDLIHLKRVRGPNILISHSSNFDSNTNIQKFIENNVPELANLFEFFREVDVPAFMPKLKWQNALVCKKWSCNFHQDMHLEKLINGELLGNLNWHRAYIAMTFEIVKWYCKHRKVDVTEDILNSVNASVVVDPLTDSVVAVSFDNRLEHPVQHSAMVVIDNVARTQGGGLWSSDYVENMSLSGIDPDLLKHLIKTFPDCKFGENSNKLIVNTSLEKDLTGPYLCTNYYVYLLREPCVMCSMALTHARVKRVFFALENKEFGALSSRAKLHTVPFLNHRFEVFTGFL